MDFLFDKTLLGLTDFLPHFRRNRVLISVCKQPRFREGTRPQESEIYEIDSFSPLRSSAGGDAGRRDRQVANRRYNRASTHPPTRMGHAWPQDGLAFQAA